MITEKVVLSAAHCVSKNQSGHLIGLGFHNLSGYSDWSEEEWRKHVIKEVKEIIVHEKYDKDTDVYDFALFILEAPERLSRKISLVCLPDIKEIGTLETKENILIGFGNSKIWFLEYEKLLGRKLISVSLMTPEMFDNPQTLASAFMNVEFHNRVIREFFEAFIGFFPGVETCIENYEFVCKITSQKSENIMKNIEHKIRISGGKYENHEVKVFLGQYFHI